MLAMGLFFARGQNTRHVVLISIDGLRPEMYKDSVWPTPNLWVLMKEGVCADHMKSVFPSYTYPSHTAMLTGALPARSGIYYNQPKGSKGEWNWFTAPIKVPTLWQVMKKNGLSTAAVEWPVSVDSNITWNIPEIWDIDHPEDRITGAREYSTPGLIEEIEKNATGKLDSNNMSEEFLLLDENAGRMASYIFMKYKPALLAVHFAEVDGAEHDFGRDGDSVRLAVASADRAIGDILETIERSGVKDSTTIIIVGDHGFSDINQVFRPNMLIKDIPARFIAAGGSAFLYSKNKNTSFVIQQVRLKLDSLPVRNRKLFRIVYRDELDKMGVDSEAILALAAVPGLVFSGATSNGAKVNYGPGTIIQQNPYEGLFVPTQGGHHGYDPNIPDMYTGFIAAGKGIKKGSIISDLCVTDIAPLIAALLGIEFKRRTGN
ncbi:MAG: ectonucleotide pyrophosphatase/phosphodiesterase [Puia sp.]